MERHRRGGAYRVCERFGGGALGRGRSDEVEIRRPTKEGEGRPKSEIEEENANLGMGAWGFIRFSDFGRFSLGIVPVLFAVMILSASLTLGAESRIHMTLFGCVCIGFEVLLLFIVTVGCASRGRLCCEACGGLQRS